MLKQNKGSIPGAARPPVEIEEAKKIVTNILLVRKHFSLYPDGHTIPVSALENLHALMSSYLASHGELRINVDRSRLLAGTELLYSGEQDEGVLPFTLFRDGIRWIEFQEGIESWELRELLRIIIRYIIMADDAEGDVVTSLWEIQLPHLRYEVSEFSWGDDSGDSLLSQDDRKRGGSVLKESRAIGRAHLAAPPIDLSEAASTPEEDSLIQDMVRSEEEQSPSAYLDHLFDSLLQYREQENFLLILGIFSEEFKAFFSLLKFADAWKVLARLQSLLDSYRSKSIPEAVQFINGFINEISGPEFLTPLQEVWSRVMPEHTIHLRKILDYMQPAAISTLARMLTGEQSAELQQMLVETIVSLASRDLRPLEALLKTNDDKLVQMLVQVIANLDGEQPVKILLTLIRHPSERVRQEALRSIFKKHPNRVRDVYRLIDDQDASIRKLVLKQMALSGDRNAERYLLTYLESPRTREKDNEHIAACFATLGQCATIRSLPFLRKTLLEKAWMPGFWNRTYREGAAEALGIMGTSEAQGILNKARHSFFPGLRRIARRAG
jgi:hypothetical protein